MVRKVQAGEWHQFPEIGERRDLQARIKAMRLKNPRAPSAGIRRSPRQQFDARRDQGGVTARQIVEDDTIESGCYTEDGMTSHIAGAARDKNRRFQLDVLSPADGG
mgnify:CR=1 FL=1